MKALLGQTREVNNMDDLRIIELYFERDEQAIKETDVKYGKLCHSIAYNILNNHEDSEECVNDTYVGVWNAIPPTMPNNFMSFVCRIARNLSLKRLEFMKREKRSADVLLSLDELASVLPDERLLMCDKEAIEVQKILPFLSDTWPLCRIGRAVIRASQSCRQSCNKSQCPACGCRSHHSCTHAPQFSRSFPAREWGSVLQRQGACGQCP